MKKLLLFSSDPGGANLIVAMHAMLKEAFDVHIYGKETSLNIYQKNELEYKNIKDSIFTITQGNVYEFVSSQNFDGILTSTSADDFTERLLWLAAKKRKIYHGAILDQWMNYSLRFLKSHKSYQSKEKYNVNEYILPKNIFVMDEYAQQAMIKEGIPAKYIKVTGQPYFEHFINQHKKPTSQNINNEKLTWLFASEPITTVYGKEKGLDLYGYTEQSILYAICNAINEIPNNMIELIIKPHPRENSEVYSKICNQFNFVSLILLDSVEAILQSDAVLGMSSTLLLEAALLNKPILSIQLNLKIKSPFILDQIDKSKSVLNEKKLKNELILLSEHRLGLMNSKFIINLTTEQNAIQNIFFSIKKELND